MKPITLNEVSSLNLSPKEVGNKTFNLSKLLKTSKKSKEFEVPSGFVLPISLLKESFKNILQEKIYELNSILKKNNFLLNKNCFEVLSEIKKLIQNFELPDELEKEILKNCEKDGFYAVRSSSIFEDSEKNSFAGIHESYLNIPTEEVSKYIKKCFSSLFNEKSLSFRLKNEPKKYDIEFLDEMAIIVQKQIHSEKSGVIFTVNPLNGNRNRILIESSYGLGDLILNGKIIPDSYEIHKSTLTVTKKIGEKLQKNVINKNGNTTTIQVEKNDQIKFSLSEIEVEKLCKIAFELEKEFDSIYLDIEFSIVNDDIYILQVRPITNIFPRIKFIPNSLKSSLKDNKVEHLQDEYFRIFFSINDSAVKIQVHILIHFI